jgi:hypothetical protein
MPERVLLDVRDNLMVVPVIRLRITFNVWPVNRAEHSRKESPLKSSNRTLCVIAFPDSMGLQGVLKDGSVFIIYKRFGEDGGFAFKCHRGTVRRR